MNSKKNTTLKQPIILSSIALLGLILLIILGIKLATTDLITFTSEGDTVITITKEQEYYVLLDTASTRDDIVVGFEASSNYVVIRDVDDVDTATYMSLVSITNDADNTWETIDQIEFDKQVMKKGYLAFGKITLEEGTYTIHSENLVIVDDFGGFALLGTDYVKNIGFFSFSAIIAMTFGLLGFKTYRSYVNIPLSKYQKKHIK